MLAGIVREAEISPCRRYRWTLTRQWDDRAKLLVVMFNPSRADSESDDPTITLVCQIAAHNGYGGIIVTNLVPLVSSSPQAAFDMQDWERRGPDWYDRDRLQQNVGVICKLAANAGAVLIACGALASHDPNWFELVLEEIECAIASGTRIYCLGKTKGGYPLHPLARGKLKVRKDAELIPWSDL